MSAKALGAIGHKTAGRAISYGANPYNPYYASGSWGYMGQGDSTLTTLRQQGTSTTYTVVTSC